ncbi:uncharacterized protein fndc7b [Stegastes partitus]|uniref:Uncharacterized protein fndc7b n=2 Tax=Stegastes partitus TaxID=144197 RepID=A0A9Y4NB92_9TELE|nr:PREDICTED: uncharacterized protein LOC103366826 [Stegastes partitus]
MSKMGFLGAIGFSLVLVSLTQIHHSAEGCKILSATSSSASSIYVEWEKYPGATSYLLDLRKKNSSGSAPVVVTVSGDKTSKDVQGLKQGTEYSVTLKVFLFYFVECVNSTSAYTVTATTQITHGWASTSTSITVKWKTVPLAEYYYLEVYSQDTGKTLNYTLTNTSAVVENLQPSSNYDCYVYTVNKGGMGESSKVRTIRTLQSPPVGVTAKQTGQDTARITWQPVKKVLLYQVIIRNLSDPTSQLSTYNVSDTKLDIGGILPCSSYLILVSSFSIFLVPSEPTEYMYTTNKLMPVSSVSVEYSCTSHSVMVSWSAVFGADSYSATATDKYGTEMSCTSYGTNCWIPGLTCGQSYVVHVTPMSQNCKNTINATSATFHTVPCPPTNLKLVRECTSHAILFSWNHTNNTDHYKAQAVDSKGGVQDCLTDKNSCYFTHTVCGRHYDFTVYAMSKGCKSEISSTVGIRTAPCIPQNLQTSSNCSSDALLSKWDHAEGALRYTVNATGNKKNSNYSCSTRTNSCVMEGVPCGQHLTISITAYDDECSSPEKLGHPAETVPCTPKNISAVKDCKIDTINVNWTSIYPALFYVAIAEDINGVIHSCNSIKMSCSMHGLECSTTYKVYVIASNFMCNSSVSEMVTVETGACPPYDLYSYLDCAANEALISWHGQHNINSYTATIVDKDHGLLSCSSTTTNCTIPNLKCGQYYTVTVSQHVGMCSISSEPIHMDSVPCGPANLHASVNCMSGEATISWKETWNAEGYITVISDGNMQMTYNTTEPKLSVDTMHCGQKYKVEVMSVNESCVSLSSETYFKEVPCVPTNVTIKRKCGQSFVDVMWQASRGAKNYTVTAMDEDGNSMKCVSNITSCRMKGVMCGKAYNVSVIAMDDACSSMKSPAVKLLTEPCPPTELMAKVNCSNNSAMLTWKSSPNAIYYTGQAVSTGGDRMTCDEGMELNCSLTGLHCGEEYTFTVSASDGECQSPDSKPVVQTTAPCAVQNVRTTLNCTNNTLMVSWMPGSMPVNYSVTAMTASGTVLRCVTEGSRCNTTLQCGQQYTVTVTPMSSTCEGPSSDPEIVNSVPCVPMEVQGMVNCSTNTLNVSWDAAAGAMSYKTLVTGPGGFSTYRRTENQSSLFPHLQCAQTYMFSVMALSDRCNSSKSAMMSATTAPCDPTNVFASLNCVSGVATVTWNASAGATHYKVIAEANGHMDYCKSNGTTSCELTRLKCGEDYSVTVLAGDAKCNSSMLARTYLTTAPCAPMIHNHSLDCAHNHACVTWDKDDDAINVTVYASSSMGDMQSCNSSTNNSCYLDKLKCGHTYSVHAVAQGAQCLSKPSTAFEVVTAPCTPANVDHTYDCLTGIAFVNWDETLGSKGFYVHAHSGNHATYCSTDKTDCSLSRLLCGQLYHIEVTAVADHCNSSMPGVTQIQTAPCAPMDLSAYLVCDNNTAAVSWQQSPGADSYTVMANGRDGDVKKCITNGTSCHLPNMHCAQTYIITVTPSSKWCTGSESNSYTYVAGPCPPTDVHATLQCVGNVGHVTWTAAPRADMYVATAMSSVMHGHAHNCSSNGTYCSLVDLDCGKTVSITVVTIERGCRSKPSMPYTFQSVICPPTHVTGVTNCTSNDITVHWDPSPESGVDYFLYSEEDSGAVANFSTTQTSHVIKDLQCGELYSVKVAARDSECTSVFSQPIWTETAPCPPTNLTVKTECATNMAILTWAPSAHAKSYKAEVTGNHGPVVTCWSNTTNCSVRVDCGHQYTAVVVACSETCNSSASTTLTFDSAPCLPDNVHAELDCNVNSFAVKWRGTLDNSGTYTAMAIGSDGSRETCDSPGTNCTIHNLKCGLMYSIAVTTSSIDCGTITDSNYKLQSAPCKPDSVWVDLQCSTNMALVTWKNSGPDQTQHVSAVDSRGMTYTCNSSSSNCTFDKLPCGETYTVHVVGHTKTCRSEAAIADQFKTAPCVPTQLTARVDCGSGITVVTWDGSRGATSYTVYALGSLGHNDHCDHHDTTCDFIDLACGQDYNITVVAHHDTCDSMESETTTASTGPCPHSDLKTELDCNTNTIDVSWSPGSGILHYSASAESFSISHQQTCSTNGSSCNITSLHCGQNYRVSVSGQGQNCPSPAQYFNRVNTAPCPPTQVKVNSSCESNNILVSWDGSQGSVSYMAVAENAQGDRWTCNTTGTTCWMSALLCGHEYKVYVVGIDETCKGAKSEIKIIHTAPCVPENVQNHLDCLSGVLNVTWQSTGHFLKFHTSVMSSKGHVSTCTTNKHHCVVRNLGCGLTYNVTVVAQDETCNSSHSPIEQISSAPCPLPSFLPVVNCSTGNVSVTWNNSMPGIVYTVFAVDAMGYRHNCSGTNRGCTLNTLKCGTEYSVTITPSRGDCVGKDSHTKMIMTVPCVPHLSDVEIDCLMNSAWVMYNYSAGAKDYIVMATDSQGNVQTFECNYTSDWMCPLPPLMCSKNLTFTLKAQDQQCTSAPSNAITTETAPCPPEDVMDKVDCKNGTISVTWSGVPGAIRYKAMLEEVSGGNTSCCTTPGTSCNITHLPCGEMYTLHVMAEGRTCNSSEIRGHITRTAPCVPEDLQVSLSCSNNVASMSWSQSKGGQLYVVKAVGTDGHTHECMSPGSQCDLTDLHCGEYYTATVTAEVMECKSKPSDSVMFKTVPCTPANISSMVDCETDSLIISWSDSPGADSYLATLEDSIGRGTTCQGTIEGSCNVTGIACGQIYHVFVVSSDGICDSPPTPVIDTPSAPCKPRHIEAVIDCHTDSAVVHWDVGFGALWYIAMATTASGHQVTCETNMTYCELEGLHCGQSYSVSVKAAGESCGSIIATMTGQLETAPCIPEHVTTHYSLTIGQVQWDMTTGAAYYFVKAETDEGLSSTCNTPDTFCALYDMKCSQKYHVKVTANNNVCTDASTSTENVTIITEPCPPKHLQATVNCQENIGLVSWEASMGAVAYKTELAGRDGHLLSCHTNDTYCDIEGLHCGVIYHTSTYAIGETLDSLPTDVVLLVSAPCPAGNVAATSDCYSNTAFVSWDEANGAISYMITAESKEGYQASCETDQFHCHLTDLHCGQMYYITITSISDHCHTVTHTNVTFSTRPCKPMYVGVDLQCGTSTANLYWEDQEEVELYMATATCSGGMTLHCNSTNSTCQFSNLTCGETYKFSVTAHSYMCYSETSSTVEIKTEPCPATNLRITGSCYNATSTVMVEWSDAPGALLYVLTASGDLGFTTSYQTNETMMETDLPCGQVYTFTVISQDERCDSVASMPEQYKTGPCIPQHVQSFTHCEDSVGAVSWATSPGAESYVAVATAQDGSTVICATNTTTCIWDDLHCGTEYTVHVTAIDNMCNSLPSNSTSIRMAPCIPENLVSSFDCDMKVGSLSWNATETAVLYIVTAENNGGHKVSLSTNETWTSISEFMCGQEYFLSVQAKDFVCTSSPSPPSMLKTEPCPPTDVSSVMNCASNIAVVSWTGSLGAEYYTATLTPEHGQPNSCMSEGQQCSMPNVQCGQNYTVIVVASHKDCDSDPSEPDTLQSVPCVPTDVKIEVDCSRNEAVVSWSSSDGAVSYQVMAESKKGSISFCETGGLMCTLTNLTCGHNYLVQVVAQDGICSSLPSPAIDFYSVPCIPDIGSVILDCYTNSALLDWAYTKGAMFYNGTARSSSGHISICSSNYTYCELRDLHCGETYTVTTVASNGQCSSPSSMSLQVTSVPCPPEGVMPVLNCSTNTAQVEWQTSKGASSYIVQAFGVEEHKTGCESKTDSCILSDLKCGFTYDIIVIAANSMCNVSQSKVIQLKAVPCIPQHVEARVVCESGGVAVSWERSKGASSYTSFAQGMAGYASTHNSNETTSLFNDLLCGHNYSITVSASNGICSSAESSAVDIDTVPCVPQNVTAKMMCSSDTGMVSWEEGEGVSSYKVHAFGPDGHKVECNNTGSSCQLPSMHCGQLYNLKVTAKDGRCDNSQANLTLQSVPCKPTNVKASLHCHSNSAAVTWERGIGAHSYVAVAVTTDGSHQTKCNHTMTYCDLTDLQCGQTYNIKVYAKDESCSSMASDEAYVQTAPCAPQNVTVDAQCTKDAMVVSWSPNPDAKYFHVAAVSNTMARLYCNSSGTTCTMKNLPCGQSYNITVISVRDDCESKPSPVVKTSSVPCVPMNPKGDLDCVSNNAWVEWDDSKGATSYFVLAQSAGGHSSNCTAPSSHCKVPDLECGTVYTCHVTAMNKYCSSNHSATFEIETGPCALTSINATTECHNDTILVEWEETVGIPIYLVTAEADDLTTISCKSNSSSCLLKGALCGTHYSVIVSTSSDKCSTLRSPPRKIKTVPCVPGNVTVVPSCKENGATVTWAHSPVAVSYNLTATGSDGHVVNCSSKVNNCSLADLHCGQMYKLIITAKGHDCTSYPSISSFKTMPCAPSGVAVDLDCETHSAMLSWYATEDAVEYFSCAQPMKGDALYCNNNTTYCIFEGLECGEIYNFSVQASNGICNSSFSPPLQAGAAPCPPTYLNVRMQRIDQSYWAMISWDRVNCSDVEYSVEVIGRLNNNSQTLMNISSYWLPRPYFELPVPCSTAYNVTVRAKNSAGVSEPSTAFSGVTVPCPPQYVRYTGSRPLAMLSWNASVFATWYTVYNVSGGSRMVLCNTTELSCQLTNFDPNATEVTASNDVGEGNPSRNITGPGVSRRRRDLRTTQVFTRLEEKLEMPEGLTVTAKGVTLYVNWKAMQGVTEYTLVIHEKPREQWTDVTPIVRSVEGTFHKETGLKPWTRYCVKVAAKNGMNHSNYPHKCTNTSSS